MIRTWATALGRNRLFLGRYGDLRDRPGDLLLDLFEFLGVRRHPKYVHASASSTVNATQAIEIPKAHLNILTEIHGEESARLRDTGYL